MRTLLHKLSPRRAIVVVLALGLVGIVAVPTILATAGRAAPAAQPAAFERFVPGGLGRIVRADATVLKKDGTTMVVHYEHGEITALSSTSITIKGLDGSSTTFAVTADTRVREKRQSVTMADLKVGDRAMVFGTKQGDGYAAVLIRCVRAPHLPGQGGPAAPAQPSN